MNERLIPDPDAPEHPFRPHPTLWGVCLVCRCSPQKGNHVKLPPANDVPQRGPVDASPRRGAT